MNKIGLIVTVNKFKYYFETEQQTWVCDSVEEAKKLLVKHLASLFSSLSIDYPLELSEFEYIWFGKQYVNTNAFNYKVFIGDKWIEPWEQEDIYSDVLDEMLDTENESPPKFEEIYGEPNPDEEVNDNFSMENNEAMQEFEKKLNEIIQSSKNVSFKEDQVKECKCDKCLGSQSDKPQEVNEFEV